MTSAPSSRNPSVETFREQAVRLADLLTATGRLIREMSAQWPFVADLPEPPVVSATAEEKWTQERDKLISRASDLWIPLDDLRFEINRMRGPAVTRADVDYKLKYWQRYGEAAEEDEPGCLDIYRREKADGTEFEAIMSALTEYVEKQQELRHEQNRKEDEKRAEQYRIAQMALLMAGKRCEWVCPDQPSRYKSDRLRWLNGHLLRWVTVRERSQASRAEYQLYILKSLDDYSGGRLHGTVATMAELNALAKQITASPRA